MGKDQHKNKNVVGAQGVFDQVGGKKIQAVMRPFDTPYQRIEGEGDNHPERAAPRRRAHAQLPVAALESDQIHADRHEHADVERNPKPDAGRHGGEIFTCQRAGQWQIAQWRGITYR